MGLLQIFVLMTPAMTVWGQRPSFLPRPVGFPELTDRNDGLGDRFGESDSTERLPIEAGGDRDLVNRLSKLPIDNQPFWFINWQALEEHRKNPQSYDLKPNTFIDPLRNPLDQQPTRVDQIQPQNSQSPQIINNGTTNSQNNDVLINRIPTIDNPGLAPTKPANSRNPDVSNINLQNLIDAAKNENKIKPASPIFVPLSEVQTDKDILSTTENVVKSSTESSMPELANRNAGQGPVKQRPYAGHKHHQGYVFT